jgi:hypothetical protein
MNNITNWQKNHNEFIKANTKNSIDTIPKKDINNGNMGKYYSFSEIPISSKNPVMKFKEWVRNARKTSYLPSEIKDDIVK